MISAQNISKYFGLTAAVNSVSFEIAQGEIVGFLGPNGAGKTTIMRMLTGYLPATKGDIKVSGYDISKNSLAARKIIGYLPENPPLYQDMTVFDYLTFAAKLRDIKTRQIKTAVARALEQCQITDASNQIIATLSKGYKQRVGIAQAIIHDPQILILDEPTSGLDPLQILQVRHLIKECEKKRTVIISTHILSEIEQIAQRVIILKTGAIVADQQLNELLKEPENTAVSLEKTFLKLTS